MVNCLNGDIGLACDASEGLEDGVNRHVVVF
jgi:hypothetical protein